VVPQHQLMGTDVDRPTGVPSREPNAGSGPGAPAASLTAHHAKILHRYGPILGHELLPVPLAGVGDEEAHKGRSGCCAEQARYYRRTSAGHGACREVPQSLLM
jgi:hypothetical protein